MVDKTAGKKWKEDNPDPSYVSKALLMACLTAEVNYAAYQGASGGGKSKWTQIPV